MTKHLMTKEARRPKTTHPVEQLQQEAGKCAKCGKCRSVCPVFIETLDETQVARGRITLAEAAFRGELEYSRRLEELIQSCVKCLRCQTICPSGVDYERILRGVRQGIAEELGVPAVARAVFRLVLPHRLLFDWALRAAALGQGLMPFERRGTMRHLPLFFMGARWIPDLARRTALQRLGRTKRMRKPVMRIAYFAGCLINYVYPEIAEATVRVLNRLNAEVIVPQGQVCCGAPVMSFGDEAAARRLAELNARAMGLDKVDAVVTACASCGRRLKAEYADMLGSRWPSEKVFDVSEFILKFTKPELARTQRRVTYHDPCHLLWGQGIGEAPRELLRRSCEYVEMNVAARCCGGGGTFSLFNYDLGVKIAEHKVAGIRASQADAVATGCPGCQLQLADRLAAAGMAQKVMHTIQVVEEALR